MDGLGDLERWAADARAREAADERVRERWLRAQAEEEASFAGVLLAAAERRATVLATTSVGRRHRGVVTGVGTDFAAVEAASGVLTLLSLRTLADLRVMDRRAHAATGSTEGDRALGVCLADVLAQAVGPRPRISVLAGAASVVGDLRAVGTDVLTMRTDGAAGVAYVGLASVSEISFLASG